jgi:hypothetical protein
MHEGSPVIDPESGGTSLFNKSNLFGPTYWWYFKIPVGTVIPPQLRIRFTNHNDTYDADHYQIEAANAGLRVDAYKQALDNLARNAVTKLYEDTH